MKLCIMRMCVLAALAVGSPSLFAGATVVDGVLVISVDSGSENIGDQGESFTAIVKRGDGTANLTGEAFKTFDGNITIEAGTLGATSLAYFGNPTGTKTLSVKPGATLDLTSSNSTKGNFSKYKLDVAGTVRRGGVNVSGTTTGPFSLSGDATFDAVKDFSTVGSSVAQLIPLNGHELEKTGAGTLTISGGIFSNGTVKVTKGELLFKSSNSESVQSGFMKGPDGGLLEVSGGSKLTFAPISYVNPSTADLVFGGDTENTLFCPLAPESSKHTTFDRWVGSLTVDSPLKAVLTNDLVFAGPVTVNGCLRTDASTGSLILTGEGMKTVNAPLSPNSGSVVFRDTAGVTFESAVTNVATGSGVIAFENAGVVTTGSNEAPFDGVKASLMEVAQGKIPRVAIKGDTVFPSTTAKLGNVTGTAVFEIADGAVVSNLISSTETSGITLHVVSNGTWYVGGRGKSLNPLNRNGVGWAAYGDVELVDGMISTVNSKGTGLRLGYGNTAEGTLAMSGGTWISHDINLGNKGYGLWYQTGGTAIISNTVTVGDATRPCDSACGIFTLSGGGTRATIPYVNANGSGFIGCCANAAVQSVVNLKQGAELLARRLWRDPNAGESARFYINFDGGIFSPMGPWQMFGNGGSTDGSTAKNPPDRVTVYSGGAVFDIRGALNSSGNPAEVFVTVPLLAPTGKGVASITLPEAAKTMAYAYRPRVYIEGDGEGATAVAELDPATCRLTGVTVTSPGWNYTEANTHVYISTNVYMDLTKRLQNRLECGVTLADNSPDGGLTVRGIPDDTRSTISLYCTNTYRGVTCCQGGMITFAIPEAYPGGGLDIWKGAIIRFKETPTVQVGSLAGGGIVRNVNVSGVTNVIVRAEDFFADGATPLTVESKTLDLADDVRVSVMGIGEYARKHGYATMTDLADAKLAASRTLVTAKSVTGGANMSVEFVGLNEQEAAIFGVRKTATGLSLRRTDRGLLLIVR